MLLEHPFEALWPAGLAVLVIAAAGWTPFAIRPSQWRVFTFGVSVLAGVAQGLVLKSALLALGASFQPYYRDEVAWVVATVAAPIIVCSLVAGGRRAGIHALIGVPTTALLGLVLVWLTPLFLLAVHCTTGDCL
ncbi:MAG TPA: hypothetical protein VJN70_09020 [Gemmatimonadaceae bacterium]|nr:hypothetical protein [Gemmatimonadaceae bacterium]